MEEMTVTIIRNDLYDNPSYKGAYLRLPANQFEIQDAMERARVKDGQQYKIVEYCNNSGEYLEFIPENVKLDELNYLAFRLSSMDEFEKLAFGGCVKMEKLPPDMKKLINITFNLKECQSLKGICNDHDLGEMYVDNNMIEVLNDVPDEVLEWLDLGKVGRFQREVEKGVYIDKCYVFNSAVEFKEIYDGFNLPEMPIAETYVFRLLLENGLEDLKDNKGQWLAFPATPEEISETLRYLRVSSLNDCIIERSESIISHFDNQFAFCEDINKIRLLADRIKELESHGLLTTYKAVLEFTDCTDIDHALDLTRNLDCYDFYPDLSSSEDYGRYSLKKTSGLELDDIAFKHLKFQDYGYAMMEKDGVSSTEYGLVRRNEKELVMEYSNQKTEQQMGGI